MFSKVIGAATLAATASAVSYDVNTTAHFKVRADGIDCSGSGSGYNFQLNGRMEFEPFANVILTNNYKWTHDSDQGMAYRMPADVGPEQPLQAKQPPNGGVGGNPHFWAVLSMNECKDNFGDEFSETTCETVQQYVDLDDTPAQGNDGPVDKSVKPGRHAYLGRCNGGDQAHVGDLSWQASGTLNVGDVSAASCANSPGPSLRFDNSFLDLTSEDEPKCIYIISSNNAKWTHCQEGDQVVGSIGLDPCPPGGCEVWKGPFPDYDERMEDNNFDLWGGAGGNPWFWLETDLQNRAQDGEECMQSATCGPLGRCGDMLGPEIASVETVSVSAGSDVNAIAGFAGMGFAALVVGIAYKRRQAVPASQEEKTQLVV